MMDDNIMQIINQIRSSLDELESALGNGGEMEEPQEPQISDRGNKQMNKLLNL